MVSQTKLSGRTSLIAYWIATGAIACAMLFGGLADLLHHPFADRTMAHLGLPAYFQDILGAWKLLAVLALLTPGTPRLKEWAYAGIVFDCSGAVFAHAASGDRVELLAPTFALGLAMCSWALRPPSRRLGSVLLSEP